MTLDNNKAAKLKSMAELINESDIASIKNIASGILKVVNDIKSDAKDLEDVIKLDPPLVARVLKVANSAYYASREKISDINQAIVRIGFEMMKYIALGQKVRNIFDKGELINGYSRVGLWKQSITVGLLCRLIFEKQSIEGEENIYTAGLLHNIGIIAIDQLLPDEFGIILEKTKNENKNLVQVENDVLGYNHAELGMTITQQWDFPADLISVVGYHHYPADVDEKYLTQTSILYAADYICHEHCFGYCDTPFRDETVFQECLNNIGLQPESLDEILVDLKKEIAKVEAQGLFR